MLHRMTALAALVVVACAHEGSLNEGPLVRRVWDARAGAFVSTDELFAAPARARHVILGETPHNPEHPRLQRRALEALAARGGDRMLAMEQLDTDQQAAL